MKRGVAGKGGVAKSALPARIAEAYPAAVRRVADAVADAMAQELVP